MHRNQLLEKLKLYEIDNPKERETRKRFEDFILSNPNCFDRSLKFGHITGSAWLINKAMNKSLLTHHKKLNKWLQLGGHSDGDPDTLRVAIREAEEESGIVGIVPLSNHIFDLDIHLIPARKDEPEHFHYDVRFLLQTTGVEDYKLSDESNDLAWKSINELKNLELDFSVNNMIKKWIKYMGQQNTVS